VCRLFAERWPELYAEREFPLPGFFLSPRRNAYFRFVLQRQFEELPDPQLVAEFERLRRTEMRDLVILVAGFAALGIAFLWLRFIRPD
jgi:hypothetical protein